MLTITFLSLAGLLVLFLGFLGKSAWNQYAAVISLLLALVIMIGVNQDMLLPENLETQLDFSAGSIRFSALILFFSSAVLLLGKNYLSREDIQSAEFASVMIFSVVGGLMLTAFTHMLTLFVGLETLGISLYILAGTDKKSAGSNESALKYLLLGAFATCLVLFGMAMIYGATGKLDFVEIASGSGGNLDSGLFRIGVLFLLAGILFKVSAAPFHFWSPDVYEGAPNLVMLFMSVVVKIASFAALYRLFGVFFADLSDLWWTGMYYAALGSLLLGNLLALVQDSLKRQLAYSSISHTGYLLFAILVSRGGGNENGVLFYLFGYGLAMIAAFSVLLNWFPLRDNIHLKNLIGASEKSIEGSVILTIAFLSMAGIPLTAGFFGKLYMFSPAMKEGLYHLLVAGIVSTLVGAAYYLRPIINVWKNGQSLISEGENLPWMAYFSALLILMSGLFPDLIVRFFQSLG
jgi:NADH-quinone oxidoreductase subunit N